MSDELRGCNQPLLLTVRLGASDDRELSTMQALIDVMEWFEKTPIPSQPVTVGFTGESSDEIRARIVNWFKAKYGAPTFPHETIQSEIAQRSTTASP